MRYGGNIMALFPNKTFPHQQLRNQDGLVVTKHLGLILVIIGKGEGVAKNIYYISNARKHPLVKTR